MPCTRTCTPHVHFYPRKFLTYSSLQYINRDLSEEFYTIDNHPDTLYKKVKVWY